MEDILKYENRRNLYKFLIEDYQFIIKEEEFYPDMFGNFDIYLEGNSFLLHYYNDRGILSVEIASKNDSGTWYALSFVRDLIYTPDAINANQIKDNSTHIQEMNQFLQQDFDKICSLFNDINYPITKVRLEEGLKKQFFNNNFS